MTSCARPAIRPLSVPLGDPRVETSELEYSASHRSGSTHDESAALLDGCISGDTEAAERRRIDEGDLAQIDHEELPEGCGQVLGEGRAGRDVELPSRDDDPSSIYIVRINPKRFAHSSFPLARPPESLSPPSVPSALTILVEPVVSINHPIG